MPHCHSNCLRVSFAFSDNNSTFTHPHGCVHKQDEDGHGVDRHEVAHHPPALLLARRLALAWVQTWHWPHTRHRALGVHIIIVILQSVYLTSEAALMGGVARPGPM